MSNNSKASTLTECAPPTVTPEGLLLRQFNYQGIIETVQYYFTDLAKVEALEAACISPVRPFEAHVFSQSIPSSAKSVSSRATSLAQDLRLSNPTGLFSAS